MHKRILYYIPKHLDILTTEYGQTNCVDKVVDAFYEQFMEQPNSPLHSAMYVRPDIEANLQSVKAERGYTYDKDLEYGSDFYSLVDIKDLEQDIDAVIDGVAVNGKLELVTSNNAYVKGLADYINSKKITGSIILLDVNFGSFDNLF